MILEKSIKR